MNFCISFATLGILKNILEGILIHHCIQYMRYNFSVCLLKCYVKSTSAPLSVFLFCNFTPVLCLFHPLSTLYFGVTRSKRNDPRSLLSTSKWMTRPRIRESMHHASRSSIYNIPTQYNKLELVNTNASQNSVNKQPIPIYNSIINSSIIKTHLHQM